jgi:MFS family permease
MALAVEPEAIRSARTFDARAASAVGVAAAAMVATLPGRTHGLGLVTEPLLAEFQLDRVSFAALNLWATLIGAAFCVPAGCVVDRFGVRAALCGVCLALGATVLAMAHLAPGGATFDLFGAPVPAALFVLVTLTRGFGQSALSVVSLALVGKVSGQKPGLAVGAYSFLVAVGFMAAFGAVKVAFEARGAHWREVWAALGWALLAFGSLALVFVRNPREAHPEGEGSASAERSYTLGAALRTPAFWVFGVATSFYGMVAAGVSLFNESLLAERGFERSVFLTIATVSPLVGLGANLLCGWLAVRVRLGAVLAGALVVLAAVLACFPLVASLPQVYANAVAMGASGGALTVVFFTVWRQAFGPAHLGRVQGAAQLLTVLASAAGPLVLAAGHRAAGGYAPVVRALAVAALALAALAWFVPLPGAAQK